MDNESSEILNVYCKQNKIDKAAAIRKGIYKLKSELKKIYISLNSKNMHPIRVHIFDIKAYFSVSYRLLSLADCHGIQQFWDTYKEQFCP